MPRLGRTPERKHRHHKPMHSARKGNGHDSKVRKQKRALSVAGREYCPFCKKLIRHTRAYHENRS